MKRVCTLVATHRRWLSIKGVTDAVSWLLQPTDIFTKYSEVNLQLQGNDVNITFLMAKVTYDHVLS